MTSRFSYQADARPVQKYRDEIDPTVQTCNIAVDPRIYRGSTYARRSLLTEKVEPIPPVKRKVVKRDVQDDEMILLREGFADTIMQTDPFDGEVIVQKQESTAEVQTDPYTEKPLVKKQPVAVTVKGVRTDIQDLFDFSVEVKPFVNNLVQKAIEDALMEVNEEEQLATMTRYFNAYEYKKKAELKKIQEMEDHEMKKFQEKERIVAEAEKVYQAKVTVRSKVMARGFAEFFSWDIEDDVISRLRSDGFFYDETQREIDTEFIPFISEKAQKLIKSINVANILGKEAESYVIANTQRMPAKDDDIVLKRGLFIEDRTAGIIREALRKK